MSRDCFHQGFFHESPSPKPLKITVGSFRFFSKIHRDIRQSRCTTGVKDTGGNDTGGAHWAANISANVKRKSKTALMVYSGAWGKLIHKKTRSRKSRGTVPLSFVWRGLYTSAYFGSGAFICILYQTYYCAWRTWSGKVVCRWLQLAQLAKGKKSRP